MKTTRLWPAILAIFSIATFPPGTLNAQSEAFTYQGRLTLGGVPASGNWDLQFRLFDAAINGNQVGSTITLSPVPVNSGLFSSTLDFGNGAFNGGGRWIEIGARTNGSAAGYTNLVPRVAILPTPLAINAANGVPVGSVMAFMGTNAPPGWLLCDGRAISRTNYAALYAVIGTASGWGDQVTTFRLPDLRGVFLRGVNAGRDGLFNDPDAAAREQLHDGGAVGDNVGSIQRSRTGDHTHGGTTANANGNLTAMIHVNESNNVHARHRTISSWNGNDYGANGTAVTLDTGMTRGAIVVGETSGINSPTSESRPLNTYVNYIIKH